MSVREQAAYFERLWWLWGWSRIPGEVVVICIMHKVRSWLVRGGGRRDKLCMSAFGMKPVWGLCFEERHSSHPSSICTTPNATWIWRHDIPHSSDNKKSCFREIQAWLREEQVKILYNKEQQLGYQPIVWCYAPCPFSDMIKPIAGWRDQRHNEIPALVIKQHPRWGAHQRGLGFSNRRPSSHRGMASGLH